MSEAAPPSPRRSLPNIGKRNIAYLVFVALLALWPFPPMPWQGRQMAEFLRTVIWGVFTVPFAVWNLVALVVALRAGATVLKPVIAVALVLAFLVLARTQELL